MSVYDLQIQVHFHWKFWEPKDCVGGPIYFGKWVRVTYWDVEEKEWITTEQSWSQFLIKADMGLFR